MCDFINCIVKSFSNYNSESLIFTLEKLSFLIPGDSGRTIDDGGGRGGGGKHKIFLQLFFLFSTQKKNETLFTCLKLTARVGIQLKTKLKIIFFNSMLGVGLMCVIFLKTREKVKENKSRRV